VPRVAMGAPGAMVIVSIHGDQIERTETNAAFGSKLIGERLYLGHLSLQYQSLDAVVVIQMHMRRRNDKVVVLVLHRHQPLREGAYVVVVDVGEVRDACRVGRGLSALFAHRFAHEVAHRLRSVLVAANFGMTIELPGKLFIERNRDSLHVFLFFDGFWLLEAC
jgi:hypothetical protein